MNVWDETTRGTCDACRRPGQRCERLIRGGMSLLICVEWRACIAAQPPLDELLGRKERGSPLTGLPRDA